MVDYNDPYIQGMFEVSGSATTKGKMHVRPYTEMSAGISNAIFGEDHTHQELYVFLKTSGQDWIDSASPVGISLMGSEGPLTLEYAVRGVNQRAVQSLADVVQQIIRKTGDKVAIT